MITADELKSLGVFQKTHGLKGELNAMFSLDAEFLTMQYPVIIDVDGIFVPFYAESVRPKGANTDLIKLEGVDSEEKAKYFVNKEIYGLRKDIADFLGEDADNLMDADSLEGFTVSDAKAGNIGVVKYVDDSTANVLLVVENACSGELMYIPLVDDFIIDIDAKNNHISIDVPQELINLNSTLAGDEDDGS